MAVKNLSALFICLFLGLSAFAQKDLDKMIGRHNSHSIPYISIQELKMHQKNASIVLLDAREREEFEVSHIKDALYVGYSNFSAKALQQKVKNKDQAIVVYCSLGIRSETISEKLKALGYTNVRNLYGGIFEWKNNRYAVFDSRGNETEKVHAYSRKWSKWLTEGEKIY